MEDCQGQDEDEEVSRDVETGMAPIHGLRLTECCGTLCKVPEGVKRDARSAQRCEDVSMADENDAEEDLCGETDRVVAENADVQAQD